MSIRLFIMLMLTGSFSMSAQAQDCDRSCLADYLEQYLDAMIANDATQAPLSYGFR